MQKNNHNGPKFCDRMKSRFFLQKNSCAIADVRNKSLNFDK